MCTTEKNLVLILLCASVTLVAGNVVQAIEQSPKTAVESNVIKDTNGPRISFEKTVHDPGQWLLKPLRKLQTLLLLCPYPSP